MHATTQAPTSVAPRVPARDATAPDALRRLQAFEATGLLALKAAYPGLRHERKGLRIEWFMRVARPVGAQGVSLKGDLALDCPCCDETSELLDAMAEANDPLLRRADLDDAIADEVAFLEGRLKDGLGWLRNAVRADLKAGGRDVRQYLSAVERGVSGLIVELYPVESQSKATGYKPGKHVGEVLRAVMVEARKRPPVQASAKPRAPQAPAAPSHRVRKGREPQRPARPFRMRRWSPIYE